LKRILLVALALVLISGLVLSGCSSTPSTTAAAPKPTTAVTTTAATTAAPATTTKPATTAAPTSAATSTAPQKTWNLKFSFEQNPTAPITQFAFIPWAKDVERVTNGRVKVTLYDSQTLMKSSNVFDGLKTGIADVAWTFTGLFPGQYETFESVTLPFLSPSSTAASRTSWALYQKYPEIQKLFSDVKMLSTWTSEPFEILGTKKNFKTLADFQNTKLRITAGSGTDMMTLLGATPVNVTQPDFYLGMKNGVVEGGGSPAEAIIGFKHYEVAPFITYAPNVLTLHVLAMSTKVWNDFPKDIQDAIMSVSGDFQSTRAGNGYDQSAKDLPAFTKNAGFNVTYYTVPADELAKWNAVAGTPVVDKWLKSQAGKNVTVAPQIMTDTLAFEKQYSPK
jgi:TRAP-type C4-dicarboxylate transport system substrate-binding protein